MRTYKRIAATILSALIILSSIQSSAFTVHATGEASATSVTRQVSNEAEFNAALADTDVDVIELTTVITLSRSADSKDNAFVIDRPVTITGGGLLLESSGIILGADVIFENMTFDFSSPVRNAIIANGYALTLNNVSAADSTYNVDLFCGGITDYNGGNPDDIPAVGSNGSITIKGTNQFTGKTGADKGIKGGNIYAGSLSDLGHADEAGNVYQDAPNEYIGSASITVENGATGFANIYAHGAREDRSGGHANEWSSGAELYKVSGDVSIYLNYSTTITIDGATGGTKNAAFIYKDGDKGNVCSPVLSNVDSIQLIASDNGVVTHLAPNTAQTNYTALSVPENTRLSFVNMADKITAETFTGGGEIIFAEAGENTQKLTLGSATGTTDVVVGGVDAEGTGSTGIIYPGWNCITVTDTTSEYAFSLLPASSNTNMKLEEDGTGVWTTVVEASTVKLQGIEIEESLAVEEGIGDVYIPATVYYYNEDDFVSDIPMRVTVNGKECAIGYGYFGYEYFTGTTSTDIIMWFDFNPYDDYNDALYIKCYDDDIEANIPAGRYDISITIPAENMADGKEKVINTVLTVGTDVEYLVGATSKLLGSGTSVANISMNPSNGYVKAGESVAVTAPDMLGYTFKGWYLATDVDESYQIIDGRTALSTSFTYSYTPDADVTLVAVYEAAGKVDVTFSGSGFTVSVDGGEPSSMQDGTYTSELAIGSEVTITVADEKYVNWLNENKKIVTTENVYTFTVTGDVTLTMSKQGTAGSTAMVAFVSAYNQVIASQTYDSDDTITFPDGPSKMGYTFKVWNLTEDAIHTKISVGETHITVTPVYEQDTCVTYTVTVYVDGVQDNEQTFEDVLPGSAKKVNAPAVDGKVFLYWTDADGNILGYDASYFMQVNKDIVVKAVYGEEEITAKPVIAMTNVYDAASGSKNRIAFSVTRDIPEGYTLVEHGMLANRTDFENPTADNFIMGAVGVTKFEASDTSKAGVYTLNINVTGSESIKVVARGYMIIRNDETGDEEIYYTDVACYSYDDVSDAN